MVEKFGRKRFSILIVSCIMLMLLLFYALVDFTFAWLFVSVEKDSTGTTNLAQLSSSHTANAEIEVTMPQANNSLELSNKVLIKNTGSTDALLRVFYTIYIDENINQIATTSAIKELIINSSFVASDENIENVYSGYYYYNTYMAPNAEVDFLTSVVPTAEIATKPVKIKVMYELVNYTGGAFQLGQDLPWNNTPAAWAFNYDYVTKTSSSTISPKLDIKFSEVSKIQVTAKTTSTDKNILFCQYGGAYIGLQNSNNWTFNQLKNGRASLSPTQFANGDFNTIVFTFDGCTSTKDDYITLVWDTAWSKEISYKQIKIWDKNGDLVYDLVPKISRNALGDVSSVNIFDNISRAALNMYMISGDNLISTTNKYEYFCSDIIVRDCEGYSDGGSLNASNGGQAVIVSNESHYGSKCIKVTNTKNMEDVVDFSSAKLGWFQINAVAGYRYTISMWVKSDAPVGAMTYKMYNGKLYGTLPGVAVSKSGSSQTFSMNTSYYSSNEWTLISLTTPVITEGGVLSYCFDIPAGIQYKTYIDDLVVRAHI